VRAANQVDDRPGAGPIFRARLLDWPLLWQGEGLSIVKNRLRFRIARLAAALGVVAALWACNAPFIPVPPPGHEFTKALVSDGMGGQKVVWTAHGEPFEDGMSGRVYVFDATRGAGVIGLTAPDGSYTSAPFDGTEGDRVEVSYETAAGGLSNRFCYLLQEGPMAPVCPPTTP
jgi:hypothetical protein